MNNQISQYRIDQKMTQINLANKCGWTGQGRVSQYETSRRTPSVFTAIRLAQALSTDDEPVTVEDLFQL